MKRSAHEWRELFRDGAAWEAATTEHDDAESALSWMTDVVLDIQQQLTDNKPFKGAPKQEWSDYDNWKADALRFKTTVERRKRELLTRLKPMRREATEAESREYQRRQMALVALARADLRERIVQGLGPVLDEPTPAVDVVMRVLEEATLPD